MTIYVSNICSNIRNVGIIPFVFGAAGRKYVHAISVCDYSIIRLLVIFGFFLMLVAFKKLVYRLHTRDHSFHDQISSLFHLPHYFY